jgi:hypothetical protein
MAFGGLGEGRASLSGQRRFDMSRDDEALLLPKFGYHLDESDPNVVAMRPSGQEGSMTGKNANRTPYRIVARSELGERYAAAFDGMRMEAKDGETVLTGEIVDQAHLFGVLERINGLGLRLLSVQPLPPNDAHSNADGGRELQAASETQGQMP